MSNFWTVVCSVLKLQNKQWGAREGKGLESDMKGRCCVKFERGRRRVDDRRQSPV